MFIKPDKWVQEDSSRYNFRYEILDNEVSPCEHLMKYKLVIFDFDDTLADSFAWFLRIINDGADKYQFPELICISHDQKRQKIKLAKAPLSR